MKQLSLLPEQGRVLMTTEKDAVKLNTETARDLLGDTPVFYLPITIRLSESDQNKLVEELTPFIQSFETNDDD